MRVSLVLGLALMLSGCASLPFHHHQQVNRAAKADKYAAPKTAQVEQPTPNQIVRKRWFPKFRVQWLHHK